MQKIQLFESKKIRSHWDEENELATNCSQLKMKTNESSEEIGQFKI